MSEPTVGITSAIAAAARLTGASASYLTAAASRESNFNPNARASTSSAAGLFQFIESTWLSTLSRHAQRLGLEDAAELSREDALKLRFDPQLSAILAGALAADNAQVLQARLGRAPSDGELYAAHVMGASGAARLIAAAEEAPDQAAETLFPAAAKANRGLFYDRSGTAVSVSDLVERLTSLPRSAQGAPPIEAAASPEPAGPATTSSTPAAVRVVSLRATRVAAHLTPETIEILARLDPPDRGGKVDET